jgi:MtrB/PioB family decaheme-associated outer membrane protein
MKLRVELLAACAVLSMGAGSTPPALAADMITKAPPPPPVIWWYEGYAEIGGRFYLNDPDETKLGKFYEYRDLRPGVFGNFYFGAHRTGPDPIDITASGYNVGWDDQAYELNFSQPGSYYLTFGWDETPKVYAKDARTTYSGVDFLTTPMYPYPPSAATQTFVNANSRTFDLEYRRDTASAAARWTPNDNWDITADYSHMHRHGTQPQSALTFAPPAGRGGADTRASIQFAKPVDDTTQNGSLKAEYAGSSPWGKPFNVSLGYGYSIYNNDYDSVTFQNPWIAANTATDPLFNRYSLWPDNQAQTANVSAGIGLPLNSRYMGTFQYSLMTQDQTFLPSTSNPLVVPAALTRTSLGDASTILSNNVLHTQLTSDLQSTLRYRYYDYHSNFDPMTIAGVFTNPDTNAGATVETATPLNFNKQNASAQLDYRPWKWLNVGAAWEWERWLREINGTDVVTLQTGLFDAVTNENAVKAFLDSTWGFSTFRASIRYGERRLDGNYINALTSNNNAFREVDIQDRDSTIGKASWSIVVAPMITVTPVGGFRVDEYPSNGINTFGINKYTSWNAGGDIAWVASPRARLYASYIHETGHREVYQSTVPSPIVLDTTDYDDTFMVGGKLTLIPEKLFLDISYTYTLGTSKWVSNCGPGGCLFTPMPTFPDTNLQNNRLDASLKYVFDDSFVKAAGWNGKAFVKARVIWEKNATDSWQNLEQQLGWAVNPADLTMARSVFLATGDPNYDVILAMLSFGVKW